MNCQIWTVRRYGWPVRGYELLEVVNCQRLWPSDNVNCQIMWTVSRFDMSSELSKDVTCQKIWTVRWCELSGDVNCHRMKPVSKYEMSKDVNCPRGGGGTPILRHGRMVGRFRGDDPRFGDFQSDWVPILYLITIRLTHSFCRKSVCLYHI